MEHQRSTDLNASPVTRHEPARRPATGDSSPSAIAHSPSPIAHRLVHCLTFDIEEHFQVSAFDSPMRRRHWDQFESRVERNTEKILELLRERNVRATFFVLGWVAERHQGLIRRIAREGHEVASHGYAHEMITTQTPEQFREDVKRAKGILEDLIGEKVLGFRAPNLTMTPETMWAFSILVKEGHVYDSSVLPIFSEGYALSGGNSSCRRVSTDAGPIWEIRPSTVQIAGVRMPIAGNEFFRLFPYELHRRSVKRVEAAGQAWVLCLRAWEVDPDQPRMNGSRVSRFRHYVNLHKTEERLVSLLHEFAFGPIRETIQPVRELDATRARSTQPQPRADLRRTPAKQPGRVRKLQVGSSSRSRPSASSAQNIEVI